MKKFFKNLVRLWLYPSCTVFTVILFAFALIYSAFSNMEIPAVDIITMCMLFVFSAMLAISNLILLTELDGVLKTILHFLACYASFALVFFVWKKAAQNGFPTVFILSVVFALLYAAVRGISALIKRKGKKKDDNEDYREIYR